MFRRIAKRLKKVFDRNQHQSRPPRQPPTSRSVVVHRPQTPPFTNYTPAPSSVDSVVYQTVSESMREAQNPERASSVDEVVATLPREDADKRSTQALLSPSPRISSTSSHNVVNAQSLEVGRTDIPAPLVEEVQVTAKESPSSAITTVPMGEDQPSAEPVVDVEFLSRLSLLTEHLRVSVERNADSGEDLEDNASNASSEGHTMLSHSPPEPKSKGLPFPTLSEVLDHKAIPTHIIIDTSTNGEAVVGTPVDITSTGVEDFHHEITMVSDVKDRSPAASSAPVVGDVLAEEDMNSSLPGAFTVLRIMALSQVGHPFKDIASGAIVHHRPSGSQLLSLCFDMTELERRDRHLTARKLERIKTMHNVLERIQPSSCSFIQRSSPEGADIPIMVKSENRFAYLFVENYPAGSLAEFYRMRSRSATPAELKTIFAQMTIGLLELHKMGIIHNEISPNTIFIADSGHCVLGGYEGAVALTLPQDTTDYSNVVVPINSGLGDSCVSWMSPERATESRVRRGKTFVDQSSDFWSLGLSMAFIAHPSMALVLEILREGMPPDLEALDTIRQHIEQTRLDPEFKDILGRLLTVNPEERIKGSDVKTHPYFNECDWEALSDASILRDGGHKTGYPSTDRFLHDLPTADESLIAGIIEQTKKTSERESHGMKPASSDSSPGSMSESPDEDAGSSSHPRPHHNCGCTAHRHPSSPPLHSSRYPGDYDYYPHDLRPSGPPVSPHQGQPVSPPHPRRPEQGMSFPPSHGGPPFGAHPPGLQGHLAPPPPVQWPASMHFGPAHGATFDPGTAHQGHQGHPASHPVREQWPQGMSFPPSYGGPPFGPHPSGRQGHPVFHPPPQLGQWPGGMNFGPSHVPYDPRTVHRGRQGRPASDSSPPQPEDGMSFPPGHGGAPFGPHPPWHQGHPAFHSPPHPGQWPGAHNVPYDPRTVHRGRQGRPASSESPPSPSIRQPEQWAESVSLPPGHNGSPPGSFPHPEHPVPTQEEQVSQPEHEFASIEQTSDTPIDLQQTTSQ